MNKSTADRMVTAFNSPHLFATSLLLLLIDLFDNEVINWDIITIRHELKDELGITLPEVNDHKVQAILTVLCSDSFMHDPLAFSAVARAFCNEPINVDLNTPLDPDLAAWCLTEAAMLGVDDLQNGLSEDVRRFLGATLTYAGLYQKPQCMSQAIMPGPEAGESSASSIDPDIQSAFIKKNQEDKADLDSHVRARTRSLLDQITRLPLQGRHNDSWAKLYSKLTKALAA